MFLSEKKEDEDSYENGLRDFKGKAGMETMFLGESPAQEKRGLENKKWPVYAGQWTFPGFLAQWKGLYERI